MFIRVFGFGPHILGWTGIRRHSEKVLGSASKRGGHAGLARGSVQEAMALQCIIHLSRSNGGEPKGLFPPTAPLMYVRLV